MRSFIRPAGRWHRVDHIVVDQLEQLATLDKRPRLAAPWAYPVRWALRMVPGVQ
jgi:hypothetical protein